MSLLEYSLVFVLAVLSGGWAIPAGILFDLEPIGVYVAAVLGSLTWTLAFLALASRLRTSRAGRYLPDAEAVRTSKAGEIVDRWGAPGLAIVGGVVLGPTLTLMAAFVTGIDSRRFRFWYILSIFVGFALLTAFWVLATS